MCRTDWCRNPKRAVLPDRVTYHVARGRNQATTLRDSGAPARSTSVGIAKRVRGDRVKAWSRWSPECPGRGKPKGASCGYRAKTVSIRQGFPQRAEPRNRGPSGRPIASAKGTTTGANGKWDFPDGNVGRTLREVKLRRVNPRSAAGVKQNRRGVRGSKPSRG
jgi:hypothetical protein